ncbi:MAG: cell division protein FtsZ [Candidatus Pacebacteria bacterium]|nr:cell division protein FtsZ [Candidatus Paceibacterota bacterium]
MKKKNKSKKLMRKKAKVSFKKNKVNRKLKLRTVKKKKIKKPPKKIIKKEKKIKRHKIKKKAVKKPKVAKKKIILKPKHKKVINHRLDVLEPVKKQKTEKKEPVEKTSEDIHKTRIRVIGIGSGGGAIVSEIVSRIKKADFYVANTDVRALVNADKRTKKFQFGQSLTQGLGTGMNAEIGELAAIEEKERIKKLLEGQDICIIIACLGGGTSSGSTPVFAKISKDLGNITYGIFTLPFEFEGERKMEAALNALDKIKSNFNVYTVIPNERIFEIIDKNTPLKDALSAINRRLADNLEGLIEMIYLPGLINIDFADLRTVLSGSGRLTYLNSIKVEGPNREEVIKKLVSSPLYYYTPKGAKGILYNITSGRNLQLTDVSQISNLIKSFANRNAKIIFGISENLKDKESIKITFLASGCLAKDFLGPKSFKPEVKKVRIKKKSKISLKNNKIEEKKPLVEKKKKPLKKTRLQAGDKRKIKITFSKSKPQEEQKKIAQTPPAPEISKTEQGEISLKASGLEKKSLEQVFTEGVKVRRNALEVKKSMEAAEKEILDQEKFWETPAILRKKKEDSLES